jgi:hypothetical protein
MSSIPVPPLLKNKVRFVTIDQEKQIYKIFEKVNLDGVKSHFILSNVNHT